MSKKKNYHTSYFLAYSFDNNNNNECNHKITKREEEEEEEELDKNKHFESKTLYPGMDSEHVKKCWKKCHGNEINMRNVLLKKFNKKNKK